MSLPRRAHPRTATRPGFTLVELLVVIAVITILAGLLFPTLAASRENARSTTCVSHLRQLHCAFQLYTADFVSIPPYENRLGSGYGKEEEQAPVPIPEQGAELVAALAPYHHSPAIWFCPADPFARTDSDEGHLRHRYSSYLLGQVAVWLGPLALGERAEPITMDGPVFGDGTAHPDLNPLLTDNLWSCTYGNYSSRTAYSHRDRFNYVFFDGHARSYRRDGNDCPW